MFAAGVAALLESGLGLSPWDVLHQGIARHTPLSFGEAIIAVGVVVMLAAWALGESPGFGTVANGVLVGVFVDRLTAIGAVDNLRDASLAVRILLLAGGILLIGVATALYIGAALGAGPRDSLMLAGVHHTGVRVGVIRAVLEGSALIAGIALGGTFGVGTIAYALLVGPVVELSFWAIVRTPLATPRLRLPDDDPWSLA
ncbi:MAG TPA: hypothetical protein VEH52_14445 [Gaiellaceae bacterium]|nr:hypothetical protein [Gaiellaceae bacterium]